MRTKSWKSQIPLILQHLGTDGKAVYTRAEVEALFKIGRSQATDVMHLAGATVRNGAEATVSRENLRYYLERSPEATAYLAEEERKAKLAAKLHQSMEEKILRSRPEFPIQPADQYVRLRDLEIQIIPPVPKEDGSLDRGKLIIPFGDGQDLLRQLWRFTRAAGYDYDEFLEKANPAGRPGEGSISPGLEHHRSEVEDILAR